MVRVSIISMLKWSAIGCTIFIGLYSLRFFTPLRNNLYIPPSYQLQTDFHNSIPPSGSNRTSSSSSTARSTPPINPCESVTNHFNISSSNYVMALSYWEQLTMATNSLCGLINFARRWRARVVTPFTINAEFYGLPSTINFPTITGTPPILTKGATKPISILYDMKSLNQDLFCNRYHLPPLVQFHDFLYNANRQILLLHINFFNVPPKSLFHGRSYTICETNSQIKSAGLKLMKSLNTNTRKLNLPPFTIYSACCLDHLHIIEDPMEIAKGCGFSHLQDLTLVFTVWRGYSDIPTKRFRLITSKSSLFNKPSPTIDAYPLSNGVITNASAFIKDRLTCHGGGAFAVVHLRTAKIAMMGSGRKRFKSCLNKVEILLNKLSKSCQMNGDMCSYACTRYFVDYGKFGSHSYEVKLGEKASRVLLNNKDIQPIHFDPGEYGGQRDQGYVALVEQLSMAHSSVLILMGGGSFQDQIKQRFIRVGRGKSIYYVCHSKDELTELVYENPMSV